MLQHLLFFHPAVKAVFESVHKAGAATVRLTVEEVGVLASDQMVYERSTYQFMKSDGTSFDKGK